MKSHFSYNPALFWEKLHEDRRFRPAYPNEDVVRFLVRNFSSASNSGDSPRLLDIGVGGGRHVKLLCEMGFEPYGIDVSSTGLSHTRNCIAKEDWDAGLIRATMAALPFKGGIFDGAISFGVFFYGNGSQTKEAIHELHRVLRPGGKAFIALRTTDDYRYGKGDEIEPNTFLIQVHDTNEYGTTQHFLDERAVVDYFSPFSGISFEKMDATFMGRKAVNSDWLVTAEK